MLCVQNTFSLTAILGLLKGRAETAVQHTFHRVTVGFASISSTQW